MMKEIHRADFDEVVKQVTADLTADDYAALIASLDARITVSPELKSPVHYLPNMVLTYCNPPHPRGKFLHSHKGKRRRHHSLKCVYRIVQYKGVNVRMVPREPAGDGSFQFTAIYEPALPLNRIR